VLAEEEKAGVLADGLRLHHAASDPIWGMQSKTELEDVMFRPRLLDHRIRKAVVHSLLRGKEVVAFHVRADLGGIFSAELRHQLHQYGL